MSNCAAVIKADVLSNYLLLSGYMVLNCAVELPVFIPSVVCIIVITSLLFVIIAVISYTVKSDK